MSSQFLADICYVSDSECKQTEKSSYVSCCDINIDDENCKDEHDIVSDFLKIDFMKIEKIQLTDDEDKDFSKMLIISFRFTNLPTLNDSENTNSLNQIYNHIY